MHKEFSSTDTALFSFPHRLGALHNKVCPTFLGDIGQVFSPVWASLSSPFWEELASVITDLSWWLPGHGPGGGARGLTAVPSDWPGS